MIPEPQATDVSWAIQRLTERRPVVHLADRYYRGNHRLAFASERFRKAFGTLFREFALNLCEPVISLVADRIEVVGFAADSEHAEAGAHALWTDEELALIAADVHREALIAGTSAVVVWPSPDTLRPVFYPQPADEMVVRGDQERGAQHVRYAVKWWRDEDAKRARITIYYADRIERWATTAGSLRGEGNLPDDLSSYNLLSDDDPHGAGIVRHAWGVVPVVEFPARASELRSVIPVQDALNKAVLDGLVAGEFVALPQRWATGIEKPRDENGNERELQAGADVLWSTSNIEAKWGALPAADAEKLIAMRESYIADVARVSGVPAHSLLVGPTGQPPSGESLRVAEARLVSKVRDLEGRWSRRWGRVMAIGLQMAQAPGADARLSALWRSPESRSAREDAETALLRIQAGASRRQALRELGYSDEQIATMAEESAEDERRLIDAGLAA